MPIRRSSIGSYNHPGTASAWPRARCHDHKDRLVTPTEFYELFALFNNVPQRGKAIKYGNSPPVIKSPSPHQQEELRGLDARLASAEQRFQELAPELASAQSRWE